MRWTNPQPGEFRVKKCFAFLPVIVGGHKVWLEPYYQLQKYHLYQFDFHSFYYWEVIKNVEKGYQCES